MIWPVCFISVAHLFQIHLYTSDLENVSDLIFPFDLSWTDIYHPQELIVKPSTNSFHIRPCSNFHQSSLIAQCLFIGNNDPSSYRCYSPVGSGYQKLEPRPKRAVTSPSKHPSLLFVILIIAVPCLIVGIVSGLLFMAFCFLNRRSQPQQTSPRLKSLDITPTPTTAPIKQNETIKTTQAISPTQPLSISREPIIKQATPPVKTLPNQFTPPPAQTVKPRMISNPPYTAPTRPPLKHPYKTSPYLRNNNYNKRIVRRSSFVRSHSR